MILPLALVAISGALIASINGANDVSKGIATLVDSGVTNYRNAVLLAASVLRGDMPFRPIGFVVVVLK